MRLHIPFLWEMPGKRLEIVRALCNYAIDILIHGYDIMIGLCYINIDTLYLNISIKYDPICIIY